MPGKSSDSRLGTVVGVLVAVLALALFVLDSTTGLSVPYGYDDGPFLVGAAIAAVAVALVAWQYRDAVLG